MKKILGCIFIFTLTGFKDLVAQPVNSSHLVGIWQGRQVRVEFIDHTKVVLVFTGNKRQVGTYTADFLSTPAMLEMSFPDGDQRLQFKCLVQFMDAHTLKWESFSKTDQPRNFTGNFATLKRVKN